MYASPYGAPASSYTMPAYGGAPMHTQQPVTYAAPAPTYAAPAPVTYAAPAPTYAAPAPVTYAAAPVAQPQYVQQQPQMIQRPQPQVIQQPQVQYVQQQPQVIQQPQVQYVQQQPQVIQQPQVQYVQQQPQMIQRPQMMMQQPQMMMQQPQMMMQQPQMMMAQQKPPSAIEAIKNGKVADNKPPAPQQGRVFMLATGIDYRCDKVSWAGKAPLDTQYAHQLLVDLGQRSGAQVFTLWNEQMTRQNLASHIMQVGAMCQPEDTFVFYYTGHGDQLPNDNPAAEGEEMDQCLCLVGPDGATDGPQPDVAVRNQVWMRDDEFAKTVLAAVSPHAKILILLDCCHSETMCDMTPQSEWVKRGQRAISICGCKDKQTSAGTGHGGQFSRALCETIMEMHTQKRMSQYNVSTVFNSVLDNYLEHKQAGHTQNISIHGCGVPPNEMRWPLTPQGDYVANLQ